MPIPLNQLETWSGQGAVKTSKDTYATVKSALEDASAKYQDRNFKVFLQGSYGNDTNVYAESDVDVVIRYDGAFFHDINLRPPDEQAAFNSIYADGTYPYSQFKQDVIRALKDKFGDDVKAATKAIKIKANGSRRNSDVIVAFKYKRYYKFKASYDENHVTGICFYLSDGITRVANYPNQHCENLIAKHQAANNKLKPMIRIFKNMRSKMVSDGVIKDGSAPSYFIEGLLYNVPNDRFSGNYQDIGLSILKWLYNTPDRTEFVCANEQYYLLRDNTHTCWACADGANFIDGAIKLWDAWGK